MLLFRPLNTAVLLVAIGSACEAIQYGKGRNLGAPLVVETTSGRVHGYINETTPAVRWFLGIPYAEPPVGALRFAPPSPKQRVGRTISATSFAPSCFQQIANTPNIYNQIVPEQLISGAQSEDCLYANIWAPLHPKEESLPVFIYLPGGGFIFGGANTLWKVPYPWVQRTQAHIVVVINYRVNVFGFPNSRALTDNNVGLLDQRLAVEWVRDNSAAFGGDPKRIMLWGHSAGAASVNMYSYAYPDDPIISGGICDSGTAEISGSKDVEHTNFTFLAKRVGCDDANGAAELDCMRKVPATKLEQSLVDYINSHATPALSFVPVLDNKTIWANYTDRALKGQVAKFPQILGSNSNEGAYFINFTLAGPGPAALYAATQRVIACPVAQEVRNRALTGLPTYRFQYGGNFSNISPLPWMGAYHGAELPLIFGTFDEYHGRATPFEFALSDIMQSLYLSFATYPSIPPSLGHGLPNEWAWPDYSPKTDSMLLFGSNGDLVQEVPGSIIDANCSAMGLL
ncbi:carboxylesteras-like protein [Rhizodiscina lignyota]|uniref:Carboxylic ester hydrolase n=1 Tax=Rhizodiscina lignyota TaxID=1504668 RepID=A0A9P4IBN9_9PEZI|nr:carboxylesteras-like protein [Rhizodiscina lignyota]